MTSYELVVMSGPDGGLVLPIQSGRQTIGRSPAAGLTINDPSTEPHHGIIEWVPPYLTVESLGGELWADNLTIRLGQSLCEIRETQDIVPQAPKIFHRPLLDRQEILSAPNKPENPPEPHPPMAPPIVPIASGVVLGVVMAIVTQQILFGLFALTTGTIALMTWVGSHLAYRRSQRRWRQSIEEINDDFHIANIEFAQQFAEQRRHRHRRIGELRSISENGHTRLWAHREIAEVCVGYGTREVTLSGDSERIVISDYPQTVNLAAGQVLGVYGKRARKCVTAMLARLAVEVGPADWQVIPIGDAAAEWKFLGEFTQVRSTPLDRYDLEPSSRASKQTVLLVTHIEDIAHRTSIARRVLQHERVSMLIIACEKEGLPAICTHTLNADEDGIDGMSEESAVEIAATLSRWIDPDHDGGSLQKYVSFSQLVADRATTASKIVHDWETCGRSQLSALVGESSDGPIEIDFVNDGPHAVVVGTTGSGKSEFLRTLIMSIALRHSPKDVNFILIDYKGGAAFDSCADLPHVVGVITDLDAGLAERVLVSLEAELRYREQQLRDDASMHLPRLLVVVDELAALKDDVPHFIGSLAHIAQRGRSLGFHLVVATQRPGSALSADVLANANIRLALRVQSVHDSSEVTGSGVAASFSRDTPGRVVLRLGADDLFVFQAAHLDVDIGQLAELARTAFRTLSIPSPRRPWLDALPSQLVDTAIIPVVQKVATEIVVGLVDDPTYQRQFSMLWDSAQHVFVYGPAKSGKTSTLSMMRNQALKLGHQVFAVACAGTYSSSSHQVDVGDRELLRRLLVMLVKRIDGPPTLDAQDQWILFVDDIDVWRNHFIDDRIGLENWSMFERIFLEGPRHNISCAISGIQSTALPAMLSSRVRQKWGLTSLPGRCSVEIEARELQAQLLQNPSVPDDGQDIKSQELVVAHLPRTIMFDSLNGPSSWAIDAEQFAEVPLPCHGSICVFGSRDSGRRMSIHAMQQAWENTYPHGRVLDFRSGQEDDEIDVRLDDLPTLVLADENVTNLIIAEYVNCVHLGRSNITLIASCSPHYVRSHPEHWMNTLRRLRTGLLLGQAALHDADLLGLYTTQPHVYGEAVGRGLWVVDGCPMGIVQSASA